ncbi:MAG: Asp-tRNA(Asn)/Glu-tRNA(Gln) amidotransferase subunit GatC [Fusobacteria bacterium]|nr:Asp-tRNA(Asn)/Glu-tRNA(Gln) amidotransferase subunit GatC [Fusobacteriota bacterium]
MLLNEKEIINISKNSKLDISKEIAHYESKINDVLKNVENIFGVDLDILVEFTDPTELKNIFREDNVKIYENKELITKNAPLEEDGAFVVPKIVG